MIKVESGLCPKPHCTAAALERQDLSCTYLAHHELESVLIIIIIIIMIKGTCCWQQATVTSLICFCLQYMQ
jgi:hypothetical protein